MNRIHCSSRNHNAGIHSAVSEPARGRSGPSSREVSGGLAGARYALSGLAVAVMLACGPGAWALPVGGAVSAGNASIATTPGKLTISQTSQNVSINWQSFNIGQTEAVQFVQPNSSSIALNRVMSSDPSSILGSLTANGQVFLVNPNGILFGRGAQVNVGGLVASTRDISDSNFMAGNYKFAGTGGGAILNQGTIKADGGYVALLGASVSNEGVIAAKLGTVVLAGVDAVTLDVAGDGLLNVMVTQGAVNALVQNGGLIQADGGQVLLTTQGAGNLLQSAVNNTGVIQAQTIEARNGTIRLMGDMQTGVANIGGTLDASAPNGGNGGFIETSAAHVNIANDARITTAAPAGLIGNWLIDPIDFNIAVLGGDITGATLSNMLVTNNVTISTVVTGINTATALFAAPGRGDINVSDAVAWTAAPNTTTLTLNAAGDVNINNAISPTNGNLSVCCGRDINVRSAITTVGGSVLLSAGRDVNLFSVVTQPAPIPGPAITASNGNIELCAGRDVLVNGKITLTNSGSIPAQGLGLPLGLTLIAGTNGIGPGNTGVGTTGSVYLPPAGSALRPSVTRSQAPVTNVRITYNPATYAAPTDYSTQLILVGAVVLDSRMLVFPDGGGKVFDGTLAAGTFTSLKGLPVGVNLIAGPGATTANFLTAAVGAGKEIDFTGYTLGGVNAANFALPSTCCGVIVGKTTAEITAAPVVVLPPVVVPSAGLLPVGLFPTALLIPPDLNLNVLGTGVTVPPLQLAEAPLPVELPLVPPVVVPPPVYVPPVYVPPVYPPRQDRN